jgi:hypothetical protein
MGAAEMLVCDPDCDFVTPVTPLHVVAESHASKTELRRLPVMPFASGRDRRRWVNSDGEVIASGWISADMKGETEGWLFIQIDKFDQRITLSASPCHYGGRRWFFLCPVMNRRASVLWLPRGAQHFASRHAWPGQVAYRSQFMTAMDRAYLGMERIKRRLIGNLDPQEWDLPPKPKWMRWRTYRRFVEQFERYEAMLDAGALSRVRRLLRRS